MPASALFDVPATPGLAIGRFVNGNTPGTGSQYNTDYNKDKTGGDDAFFHSTEF